MIDQGSHLYLARHFSNVLIATCYEFKKIKKKKGRNKKRQEEKKQKETRQKTCVSRQSVKSVSSEAYLLRANGFRRKLLLAFDVVFLCFDYFALHKTTSSNRDIFHKARFRWCKSLSGIKAKSKKRKVTVVSTKAKGCMKRLLRSVDIIFHRYISVIRNNTKENFPALPRIPSLAKATVSSLAEKGRCRPSPAE